MSPTKAESNRENAQLSTGPTSPEGKQRSSLNATKHGFTGQTLILTPEEKDAYEFHVLGHREHFNPADQEEACLLQDYTDLSWSLHQIFVQQSNLMNMIDIASAKSIAAGDVAGYLADTAQLYKMLSTLSIYEARRRKAANSALERLEALQKARRAAAEKNLTEAVTAYKTMKAKGKPFNPADFGFVCSTAQIEQKITRDALRAEALGAAPPRHK
jgi:hypothetical protein